MTNPHDELTNHTPLCRIATVRFCEMDRRIDQRFDALEDAIHKSEAILNTRLESMNEFRKQILEERTSFATRREAALITFLIAMLMTGAGVVISHLIVK